MLFIVFVKTKSQNLPVKKKKAKKVQQQNFKWKKISHAKKKNQPPKSTSKISPAKIQMLKCAEMFNDSCK